MTTLLLVRHATTAATGRRLGGRTETSLDDGGRAQAEAVADRLAEVPLKAIYASPLARTSETAAIVASRHRLSVVPVDGLLEVEYGQWTDRPMKPLYKTKLWPVIQMRPSLVRFPGGETIRQAQMRAIDAIEELVARHPRDVIAAVTHADVIKVVVAFYLGQPLDLFQRLVVSPASVTALGLGVGAQPVLTRFNDDGPLTRDRFAKPPVRRKPAGTAKARAHG